MGCRAGYIYVTCDHDRWKKYSRIRRNILHCLGGKNIVLMGGGGSQGIVEGGIIRTIYRINQLSL